MVVQPDQGSDTVDPPTEYQLDVTDLVRSWLDGGAPNHGLAIAPVIDPSVDEGIMTRFQVYGSEHSQEQYTPKLNVVLLTEPESGTATSRGAGTRTEPERGRWAGTGTRSQTIGFCGQWHSMKDGLISGAAMPSAASQSSLSRM